MVALLESAVIAGFLDRDDAFHPAAAARIREIAGRDRLVASVITYVELLAGAGLGHQADEAVRGFFADLIDEIHPVDLAVAERAAQVRIAKPSLKLPDALILATADVHQADVVITADNRWADVLADGRVELLRPTT